MSYNHVVFDVVVWIVIFTSLKFFFEPCVVVGSFALFALELDCQGVDWDTDCFPSVAIFCFVFSIGDFGEVKGNVRSCCVYHEVLHLGVR